MATRNGSIKWILLAIAIATFGITAGGLIWNASTISNTLAANCNDDAAVHQQVPKIDTRVTRAEEQIKAMNDRFSEFQRQSLENQKEILRALARP